MATTTTASCVNNPIKISKPKKTVIVPKNQGIDFGKGKDLFFKFSVMYFFSLKKEKLKLKITKPRAILIMPVPRKPRNNKSGNKLNMKLSISNKEIMVYLLNSL